MAERSSLNQIVQIGVEATPGTSVAATRILRSIGIEPSPQAEVDTFRPLGSKYAALTALLRESVQAPISGRGTYNELVYLLASVCNYTAPTTTTGVTTWNFTSNTFADDVPKTFTVEHGSGVRADRFSYGLVTELGMSFSRSGVEVSGAMIGKALEDGITLTSAPAPTALDPMQILPTEVSVYLDPTSAALGTTKLTRVLSAEFSLGNRYNGVYVLDASNQSLVAHVETEPDLTATLVVEADTAGMGLLPVLRQGDTRFLRIKAEGANISGGTPTTKHLFQFDMAGKINNTGGFSDQDGVYAIEFSMVGVHDSTWTKAFNIQLKNGLAAL